MAAGLLALSLACGGGTESSLSIGGHEWTAADGNVIPYEIEGETHADVTVVFVHCWMGDRSFWDAQLPALASRYRTVTLDLPGHGRATADRESWTVAGLGDDVAGLIEQLGLTDVVLVGHSMGGPVSLRVAGLVPDRILGIVAVDTLHNADFEWEDGQAENFQQPFEDDFVAACEQFVNGLFGEDQIQEVMAHVRQVGCDRKRATAGAALLRSYTEIDWPLWFREAGVPIRAINAAAPYPTSVEANRKYADFDVKLMEGVGHYPQMTRPAQFNELMLAAVAEITKER